MGTYGTEFFKIAWRRLRKNSLHLLINILGLGIGMFTTLLITSYIAFELSYDKFNLNYDQLYRVESHLSLPNGTSEISPATLGDIGPLIQEQIPEIKKCVRFINRNHDIRYKENIFRMDKFYWADSTFFDIFTVKAIEGNLKTALKEPQSLVFSESFAKKIFGTNNALNKTVKFDNKNYKVTAIVKDFPLNSHFNFEALGSFCTVCTEQYNIVDRDGFSFFTYLVCTKNADIQAIEQKINEITNPVVERKLGQFGVKSKSKLRPITSIHLQSHTKFELEANGDIKNIYIFSVLAIFIIIIAIINFINLATANSETRAKEIGLRKVMGAFRLNLFYQFIFESILISLISFIIAIGLTEIFIEPFRNLMNSPIILHYRESPLIFFFIILGVVFIGFISGSYPALYLSKFLPVKVLKGSKSSGSKNLILRKILVVFQFTITIFLLINIALLYKQTNYIKHKDLGFNKDHVLVVYNFTNKIRHSFKSLKAELLTNPSIQSVTGSQSIPGKFRSVQTGHKKGDDPKSAIVLNENRILHDYIKTYDIKIIEGRDFSEEYKTENNKVILNESAVKALGYNESPIDKKVFVFNKEVTVIGIMKDFHFKSLHEKIAPLAFTMYSNYISYISMKLDSEDIPKTIEEIEQIFLKVDPNNTFQFTFMDQQFASMYQKEERSNDLISWGTILAIFISVLGLFGLTSFMTQQRTQEIGIRKVMGASSSEIIGLFIKNQIKWLIISVVIASPLAYLSMEKWLSNFEYQTNISVWMFVFGSLTAFIIAIVTVSLVSIKAANANPIDSLKYE